MRLEIQSIFSSNLTLSNGEHAELIPFAIKYYRIMTDIRAQKIVELREGGAEQQSDGSENESILKRAVCFVLGVIAAENSTCKAFAVWSSGGPGRGLD